jgi:hypothetical protein
MKLCSKPLTVSQKKELAVLAGLRGRGGEAQRRTKTKPFFCAAGRRVLSM